jgi:hypothetical protein
MPYVLHAATNIFAMSPLPFCHGEFMIESGARDDRQGTSAQLARDVCAPKNVSARTVVLKLEFGKGGPAWERVEAAPMRND